MRRLKLFSVLVIGLLLIGCGPTVTVQNNTRFPVRAVVVSGGINNVLSPSPGESSSAEVAEGPYTVTVIPDAEWIAYAKDVRKYLNDQLANSDRLSGQQLLDVIRRLKDIAERMKQYESAAGRGASCRGVITSDGAGVVTVSIAPDSSLVVACK